MTTIPKFFFRKILQAIIDALIKEYSQRIWLGERGEGRKRSGNYKKKNTEKTGEKKARLLQLYLMRKLFFSYELFLPKKNPKQTRMLIREREVRERKEHFERQQHTITQITPYYGLDLKDRAGLPKKELHLCVLE